MGNAFRKVASAAAKKAQETSKDIMAVAKLAAGIATGNVLAMVTNGWQLLKTRWHYLVFGGIGFLSSYILIFAVGLAIISAPFGGIEEGAGSIFKGDDNEYLSPRVDIPQWSKDALSDTGGDCYRKNVEAAGQETGVPWQIIAAVDFKENDNKFDGSKDRLISIGENIQKANADRSSETGELIYQDGAIIKKNIEPGYTPYPGSVGVFLTKYHCSEIKGGTDQWCFTNSANEEVKKYYEEGDGAKWLWGGFEGHGDDLGVVGWWRNQVIGYQKASNWKEYENWVKTQQKDNSPTKPCSGPDCKMGEEVVRIAAEQITRATYCLGQTSGCRGGSYQNCPYPIGSDGRPGQFDCASLVGWAWYWGSGQTVNIPDTVQTIYASPLITQLDPSTTVDQLQVGDLVFFGRPGQHIALYAGGGEIVHAIGPECGGEIGKGPLSGTSAYFGGVVYYGRVNAPQGGTSGSSF